MRLVVRREPDRSFSLLGVLLDESRDRKLTIRTVTGSTETVPRNAQIIMMVRGSIPHFAAMHRDRLQEAAVRAPVALYEQILIDAVPKSMTATALKEKVLNAGVSADEADRAWIAASEQFKSSDDVAIKGSGKAVKYSWAGTDLSSRLEGFLP